MKKFRMMLPVMAVVFAIAGAVAGNFLPPITQGFYKTSAVNCSLTSQPLDRSDCQINLADNKPVCTVNITGHPTAYNDGGCSQILRYNPQ